MNIMKRLFLITLFFISAFTFSSTAQNSTNVSTNTNNAIVLNKYYALITVKSSIKDLKVISIDINNMEDAFMRSALAAQFDIIYKAKLTPSNSVLMQIINAFASQGFSIVSSSSAATDNEIITTYSLVYIL